MKQKYPIILFIFLINLVLVHSYNFKVQGKESDTITNKFNKESLPFLQKYCIGCHSSKDQKGDLDLEKFKDLTAIRKETRIWQNVVEQITLGEMPPKNKPAPKQKDKENFVSWVRSILDEESKRNAGDAGPVVLRRLNNAEYNYVISDLTSLTLNLTKEFPIDGAAGEGFTNTGNALVMSPSLIEKYFDSAKKIASHTVLLPDGFRFSPSTSRRDWTNETLDKIRDFYKGFSDQTGGDKVNLQGIIFDTNQGGRLPLEKYLLTTIEEKENIKNKIKTIGQIAAERKLNEKYLNILWTELTAPNPSILIKKIQTMWINASPKDAGTINNEIISWQKALWKFTSVGHIGKIGGPKSWMEKYNPAITKQDVKIKLPLSIPEPFLSLSLNAISSEIGNEELVLKNPRIVLSSGNEISLRDIDQFDKKFNAFKKDLFSNTTKCLMAIDDYLETNSPPNILAIKYNLDSTLLKSWMDYLGIGTISPLKLEGYFKTKIDKSNNYNFIKGWGTDATPLLLANSSDQLVRIPGTMKPQSIAVHPSPTLDSVVSWVSPSDLIIDISGKIIHAHPECGNGVSFILESRTSLNRKKLQSGFSNGGKEVLLNEVKNFIVKKGEVVSLIIGAKEGNHSCDLTMIDIKITPVNEPSKYWKLSEDVSANVLESNPHSDRFGNQGIWHFHTDPVKNPKIYQDEIPINSLLSKWQLSKNKNQKNILANELQTLLNSIAPTDKNSPDYLLYKNAHLINSTLYKSFINGFKPDIVIETNPEVKNTPLLLFGKSTTGKILDPKDLALIPPFFKEIPLPKDLVENSHFLTDVYLLGSNETKSIIQFNASIEKTHHLETINPSVPLLISNNPEALKNTEKHFDDFRMLFPPALCYTKIVPVDEVVTLTLFYREDEFLCKLMLNDQQKAYLDKLWDELHYISQDALTLVDAYLQLMEYATQDANPKVFEPLRKPIIDNAEKFKQLLLESEQKHLEALVGFSNKIFRKELTKSDINEIKSLYSKLKLQELSHEEAFKLTFARLFVSPLFLYKFETPGDTKDQKEISQPELSNRLSFFLWSSFPDQKLYTYANNGQLKNKTVLQSEIKRLLNDDHIRRLATEFGTQWLHVYKFDEHDEKSEITFPGFNKLKSEMHEETILFLTDLFRNNNSVLSILDSDYSFLNESLAKHYGIPGIKGPEFRKVEGLKKYNRGGIVTLGSTLSKNSGASRTSPILRGNWISEVLLGEKLPKPPKDVPMLPDNESNEKLSIRQLVEKHSSDARCAGCHSKIDPFGFTLENYDAIGRYRLKDIGDRVINVNSKLPDGTNVNGDAELKNYLLKIKTDQFVTQFCKKLLGYSLGRSVQLSDESLINQMKTVLTNNNYKVHSVFEVIVFSKQFNEIRGKNYLNEN